MSWPRLDANTDSLEMYGEKKKGKMASYGHSSRYVIRLLHSFTAEALTLRKQLDKNRTSGVEFTSPLSARTRSGSDILWPMPCHAATNNGAASRNKHPSLRLPFVQTHSIKPEPSWGPLLVLFQHRYLAGATTFGIYTCSQPLGAVCNACLMSQERMPQGRGSLFAVNVSGYFFPM